MYIRDLNKFSPLIRGGGQEFNIRPGTENVPGIYGLGKAVEILFDGLDEKIAHMKSMRDYLYTEIEKNINDISLNSDLENGVCHILSVSFKGVKGEVLLHYLEEDGICVSTGSACSSKKQDRKSTRLNSSHANISYAVFCLKKKTTTVNERNRVTYLP